MINNLSLASNPFRNRTLPYLIAAFVIVCAFAVGILSISQWRDSTKMNRVAKSDIDRMEQDLKRLNEKGEKVRQSLSPAQEQLMIAGHKLVANKEFRWSRLLSDLETVIPGSVSASRINVENVYRDGDQIKAELDFSVLAKDYQGVLQMIQRMNDSGIFRASLRGQDLQKTDRFTYSEFTLRLIYVPRFGISAVPQPDLARSGSTEGGIR